ncbi:DegQ family serine endoprotease [Simkania negevensis]|uniref:Periplasmic serine endoprotease DegP-like n=1 Tax=Simkania negevensis TaxID=83561 RepID=A0ABS3AS77_9BACT|nr:DegQ family serine endoprotease [Simkania negevensis]
MLMDIAKKTKQLFFLTAFLLSSYYGVAQGNNDTVSGDAILRATSKAFSDVAKKTTPGVVYIEAKRIETLQSRSSRYPQGADPYGMFEDDFFKRFFGIPDQLPPHHGEQQPQLMVRTQGSGFLISEDGYILTNHHVVANATEIMVTIGDNKQIEAEVIGTDPKTELALIKVEGNNYPFLCLGDSDALEVGEWVIAIGQPLGLEATVTVGIVSAKGRNDLNLTPIEDYIQTDAAINPGNSGGPLLNLDGDVIGINTAIASPTGSYIGVGFAIPSNLAQHIVDQLMNKGEVSRGFVGVSLQPIDADIAAALGLDQAGGALVAEVVKGSPADAAGIKQGDIILKFNNIQIKSLGAFRNAVALMEPGEKLILTVNRNGKTLLLNIIVGLYPSEKHETTEKNIVATIGLEVEPLTKETAQQWGYFNEQGLLITKVAKDSPAAAAGLRPGSLVITVNREPVHTQEEFEQALEKISETTKSALLLVRQGKTIRFIIIKIGNKK